MHDLKGVFLTLFMFPHESSFRRLQINQVDDILFERFTVLSTNCDNMGIIQPFCYIL